MKPQDEGESVFWQIAEVLGHDKALIFLGTLPVAGRRPSRRCFYVPKSVPPDHWLVHALGWHDAQRMARHFGGMILQPSNVRAWSREVRDKRIRRLAKAGVDPGVIAQEFGLSLARVREIIAGRKVPSHDRGGRT